MLNDVSWTVIVVVLPPALSDSVFLLDDVCLLEVIFAADASHIGWSTLAGSCRKGRCPGVLKCIVPPLTRYLETLPIITGPICLRHHHPVLGIVLDIRYSRWEHVLPEWHGANAIIEEVALVIESAQRSLLRLYLRDQIVTSRHREKHSKEQITTCNKQNLAW